MVFFWDETFVFYKKKDSINKMSDSMQFSQNIWLPAASIFMNNNNFNINNNIFKNAAATTNQGDIIGEREMMMPEDTSLFTPFNGQQQAQQKVGISTHYYWSSDMWTHGKDNDCSYIQKENLLSNPLLKPKMLVIEPNSLDNINLLSYYDDIKHKQAHRARRGMGHFRNYVYFSKYCTSTLKEYIDPKGTLIDSNRVFQFESRYFQYSLLQNKVTFIHTRQEHNSNNGARNTRGKNVSHRNNNHNNNNNNNIEEYLVFRFWHKTSDNEAIFGICRRTDDSNSSNHIYQPWQCVDIIEESGMMHYFGLSHSQCESQNEFLKLLPTPVECYQKPFNNSIDCDFDPNIHKIGNILRRGYERYMASNNSWDNGSEDSYSTGYNQRNNNNGGRYNNGNNNNSKFNNNGAIRKNEPKFDYLTNIANEMNIEFEELIDEILKAVKKAFEFGKENPNHVLTQAYIDEQNCQIFYENVLLAEINDYVNKKTYTFGVPIVDIINEDDPCRRPIYVAESVLTPQMTIENIMLNTPREKFDKMKHESWISRMENGKSFYQLCNEKGESSLLLFDEPCYDFGDISDSNVSGVSGVSGVTATAAAATTPAIAPLCNDSVVTTNFAKSGSFQKWQNNQSWNATKYYYFK